MIIFLDKTLILYYIKIMITEDLKQNIINDLKNRLSNSSISFGNFKTDTYISLPIRSFNDMLGKGVPRGKIIEVSGPPGSGKSSIAYWLISEFQKQITDRVCSLIDNERSYTEKYGEVFGIDNSNLLYNRPNSAEEAIEVIETLCKTSSCSLICIDSIAGMLPEYERTTSIQEYNCGKLAELMSVLMRKICSIADETDTTILLMNQIRNRIDKNMLTSYEITTGGNAIPHYSIIRMYCSCSNHYQYNNSVEFDINCRTIKNKLYLPYKECNLRLISNKGFSIDYNIIEDAISKNIINKRKGVYYFVDTNKDILVTSQDINGLWEEYNSNYKFRFEIDSYIKECLIREEIKEKWDLDISVEKENYLNLSNRESDLQDQMEEESLICLQDQE